MPYVTIPKDLTKVKSKVLFNLTKRQLVCFSAGLLVGVPLFLLTKEPLGNSTAALLMILTMLPAFLLALYEKNGQHLEVIIRNVAAGHFSLRMGVPEGKVFKTPILEYSYKNDDLHDPFINHYYALALDLATQEELDTIAKYAFKVNEVLKKIMLDANIRLIDFKLEFGRLSDGTIILADEISPDTCRFWDATTGAHLDKDLFRRSLGGEADAYQEVMKRLLG